MAYADFRGRTVFPRIARKGGQIVFGFSLISTVHPRLSEPRLSEPRLSERQNDRTSIRYDGAFFSQALDMLGYKLSIIQESV